MAIGRTNASGGAKIIGEQRQYVIDNNSPAVEASDFLHFNALRNTVTKNLPLQIDTNSMVADIVTGNLYSIDETLTLGVSVSTLYLYAWDASLKKHVEKHKIATLPNSASFAGAFEVFPIAGNKYSLGILGPVYAGGVSIVGGTFAKITINPTNHTITVDYTLRNSAVSGSGYSINFRVAENYVAIGYQASGAPSVQLVNIAAGTTSYITMDARPSMQPFYIGNDVCVAVSNASQSSSTIHIGELNGAKTQITFRSFVVNTSVIPRSMQSVVFLDEFHFIDACYLEAPGRLPGVGIFKFNSSYTSCTCLDSIPLETYPTFMDTVYPIAAPLNNFSGSYVRKDSNTTEVWYGDQKIFYFLIDATSWKIERMSVGFFPRSGPAETTSISFAYCCGNRISFFARSIVYTTYVNQVASCIALQPGLAGQTIKVSAIE